MANELIKKYAPKVDEVFAAESKLSLLTNTDYDWSGANSVKIRKVTTAKMNDYARNRSDETPEDSISRYGKLLDLDSSCQEALLSKDRSFIFNLDALDQDETGESLEAKSALARQVREVVIPEVDTWVYGKMAAGAGITAPAGALTAENIYDKITEGTEALDDAEVPDTDRALVVTPATYRLMKKSPEIILNCDVGAEMRAKVKNCILMEGTVVGDKADLAYIITDKNVLIRNSRTLTGCDTYPIVIGKDRAV